MSGKDNSQTGLQGSIVVGWLQLKVSTMPFAALKNSIPGGRLGSAGKKPGR